MRNICELWDSRNDSVSDRQSVLFLCVCCSSFLFFGVEVTQSETMRPQVLHPSIYLGPIEFIQNKDPATQCIVPCADFQEAMLAFNEFLAFEPKFNGSDVKELALNYSHSLPFGTINRFLLWIEANAEDMDQIVAIFKNLDRRAWKVGRMIRMLSVPTALRSVICRCSLGVRRRFRVYGPTPCLQNGAVYRVRIDSVPWAIHQYKRGIIKAKISEMKAVQRQLIDIGLRFNDFCLMGLQGNYGKEWLYVECRNEEIARFVFGWKTSKLFQSQTSRDLIGDAAESTTVSALNRDGIYRCHEWHETAQMKVILNAVPPFGPALTYWLRNQRASEATQPNVGLSAQQTPSQSDDEDDVKNNRRALQNATKSDAEDDLKSNQTMQPTMQPNSGRRDLHRFDRRQQIVHLWDNRDGISHRLLGQCKSMSKLQTEELLTANLELAAEIYRKFLNDPRLYHWNGPLNKFPFRMPRNSIAEQDGIHLRTVYVEKQKSQIYDALQSKINAAESLQIDRVLIHNEVFCVSFRGGTNDEQRRDAVLDLFVCWSISGGLQQHLPSTDLFRTQSVSLTLHAHKTWAKPFWVIQFDPVDKRRALQWCRQHAEHTLKGQASGWLVEPELPKSVATKLRKPSWK